MSALRPTRTAAHNGASSRRHLPGFSPSRHAAALVLCLVALLAGYSGTLAKQGVTPEQELAARFAPIIMLQRQNFPCDQDGEPDSPAPVDVVFADDDVVLRQGPHQESVEVQSRMLDLFALPDDFATDFPGKPRTPGCDYETHFKAVMGDRRPVIYASIATEDERHGIALQYWFFYYFNDFNNLHEGDWEMIHSSSMQTASRVPLKRSRLRSPSRNTVGARPPIGCAKAGARGDPPGRLRLERVACLVLRSGSVARLG